MSRRQLKSDDVAGFTLAISDEIAEIEAMYRVEVHITFRRTSVRGRLRIRAYAWKDIGRPTERAVASWDGEYPTAQATSFHAALYRACIGIGAACGRAGLPYRGEDSPAE